MNNLEETFCDMEKNCISCAQENKGKWIYIPSIGDEFDALLSNAKALEVKLSEQKQALDGGYAAQKKIEMKYLTKLFCRLNQDLIQIAQKENNTELLKKIETPINEQLTEIENNTIIKFNTLLSIAHSNLKKLSNFGVSKESLDLLEAKLEKIKELSENKCILKHSNRSSVIDIISEGRNILKRIDHIIESKVDDKKFVNEWFEARKINDEVLLVQK